MNSLKHLSSLCIALAIAYFSYALILFVDEVGEVRVELPKLLTQIEALESKADLNTWSAMAAQIDKQLPLVVSEVERARLLAESLNEQIPAVLEQVKLVNTRTIPSLVKEVAAVRTQTVPAILAESATLRENTVPAILAESNTLRESTVPALLAEVTAVRKLVPVSLEQLDKVVDKAQQTGERAAEGAVKGTVEGVIKTPFNLLKDAGKALTGK